MPEQLLCVEISPPSRRPEGPLRALSRLLTGIFKFFSAKTRCVAIAAVPNELASLGDFSTAVI